MACASCGKRNSPKGLEMQAITSPQQPYPFLATDIHIVDDGQVRRFDKENDWNNNKHKLLVLIPETFTPVCKTELGAINKWYEAFEELGCELIAVGTDPAGSFADWYASEPMLANPQFKTLSSYLLPSRLGLLDNGRAKRASVFVMSDGDIIKQEHFHKVGRSFAELHRMLYGYTTDSYCAEGWISPEDGFLQD